MPETIEPTPKCQREKCEFCDKPATHEQTRFFYDLQLASIFLCDLHAGTAKRLKAFFGY